MNPCVAEEGNGTAVHKSRDAFGVSIVGSLREAVFERFTFGHTNLHQEGVLFGVSECTRTVWVGVDILHVFPVCRRVHGDKLVCFLVSPCDWGGGELDLLVGDECVELFLFHGVVLWVSLSVAGCSRMFRYRYRSPCEVGGGGC